jgi:selenide,water dikinase
VLDDPRLYGEIAAANALSDVYAMGGRPFSALSLAGFPKGFSREWMGEILRGGNTKVRESGAILAGGHTVESDVQFGYAITGLVDPERVATNAGARGGDVAYLTKPLGMGCMTTAAKLRKIDWDAMEPAARQMATLNDRAARAMATVDFHACTDITGFGLIGHSMNIAKASDLAFRIRCSDVPLFPDVIELARRKLFSGGAARGRDTLGAEVTIAAGVEEALASLFFDAETSGGLLIVVDPADAPALEEALRAEELPVCAVGEFVSTEATGGSRIELV